MIFRALSTAFLLVGIAGVLCRNADADVIAVLGWGMIVVGFIGQLLFGLLYFFFYRDF